MLSFYIEQIKIFSSSWITHISPVFIPFIMINTIIFYEQITTAFIFILISIFLFNFLILTMISQHNIKNPRINKYEIIYILVYNSQIILFSFILGITACYISSPPHKLHGLYFIKGQINSIQYDLHHNMILTIKTNINSSYTYIKVNTQKWALSYINIGDTILGEIFIHSHSITNTNYGYATDKIYILKQNPNNILNTIHEIRSYIYNLSIDYHHNETNTFLTTLLIGAYKKFDYHTHNTITSTGLSHILCISGLHISLIFYIIFHFFRTILNILNYSIYYINNIKLISFFISLILTGCYTLLTGLEISAIRAYLMLIYFSINHLYFGNNITQKNISFILICMILFNPYYIYDISFQLSFICIFAINESNNNLNPSNTPILTKDMQQKSFIYSYLHLYFYLNLFLFPILTYHFQKISLFSIISNILIIPILTHIILPLTCIILLTILLNLTLFFKIILYLQKEIISLTIVLINKLSCIPYMQIERESTINLYFIFCILSGIVLSKPNNKYIFKHFLAIYYIYNII